MGASRARKALTAAEKAPVVTPDSSDDDDANCDLSLEIVERAKRRSARQAVGGEFSAEGDVLALEGKKGKSGKKQKEKKKEKKKKKKADADVEEIVDDFEVEREKKKKKKKREKEEDCQVLEDVDFEGGGTGKEEKTAEAVQMDAAAGEALIDEKKKGRKKRKKQRENGRNELLCGGVEVVDAIDQEELPLKAVKEHPAGSQDSIVTDLNESSDPDNVVLRKLLRIPRYFDTEKTPWNATCYNCGEEGHYGAKCTAERRKRPCFLCGEFGHNSNHCPRGLECFACKQVGHAAKNCTKKQKKGLENLKMCLRCGENDHEMAFCTNDYSSQDLDQIQCYVCGKTGHLCCSNVVDASPVALPCYNCGQTGHTGSGCAKPRWQVGATDSTTLCHLCGEEGHFARGCTKRTESVCQKKEVSTPIRKYHHYDRKFTEPRWNGDKSTPGREFDWNRQYSGSRSAPNEWKVDKKKNMMQDQSKTARKPRIESGWMVVDKAGTMSNKKHRANGWQSSSTSAHRLDFENRHQDTSSSKKQKLFSIAQRPLVSVNH